MNPIEVVQAELGIADPGGLELTGQPRPGALSSRLAVADGAVSSVVAALTTASDLALARTSRRPEFSLDTGHVAAAMADPSIAADPEGRGLG